MKSYDFVQMYKEKNNLPSDYQAAKALNITRGAMSNYKHGRPLDDDLALPIAQSLGIEPSEILYVIRAEKAKDIEHKKAWSRLAKMTKQAAYATTNLLIPLSIFMILFADTIYYVKSAFNYQRESA